MDETLKVVDEKIQAILKEHNCTLTINHVITINKLKPEEIKNKNGFRSSKKNTK